MTIPNSNPANDYLVFILALSPHTDPWNIEAIFWGLGRAMLKLQRSLATRKWGIFPWMAFFLWVFFLSFHLMLSVDEWSIQSGSQHTLLNTNPVQLNLVFEWPLTDGHLPVEILEISWRSVPLAECSLGTRHPSGRTPNQTISEHFLRWVSKRWRTSGHWTVSQECGQGTHGGQQKPDTLQLQPHDACWVSDACAPLRTSFGLRPAF